MTIAIGPADWLTQTKVKLMGDRGNAPLDTREAAWWLLVSSEIDPLPIPIVYLGCPRGVVLSWHCYETGRKLWVFVRKDGAVQYTPSDCTGAWMSSFGTWLDRETFRCFLRWVYPSVLTGSSESTP